MDEVQVHVPQSEPLTAGVERRQRGVVPLVGIPQLRRDEHVLARQPRVPNGLTNALLVAVCGSGVDVPVADLQRR